jgi:hypothetical protein
MVEDTDTNQFFHFGGGLERALERRADSLGIGVSVTGEWAWVVGRAMLVLATGIGILAFLRGTPPFAFTLGAVGVVLLYNFLLSGLIFKGRIHSSFFLGLTLDTVFILLGWAVTTAGLSEDPEATDNYLIMFLIVAVIRLGWPFGVVQGTVFIG